VARAGGGDGRTAVLVILAAVLLWFVWGTFYTVQPNETGINLVLGRYTGKTAAGLNTRSTTLRRASSSSSSLSNSNFQHLWLSSSENGPVTAKVCEMAKCGISCGDGRRSFRATSM